jgi:hypothetical protein
MSALPAELEARRKQRPWIWRLCPQLAVGMVLLTTLVNFRGWHFKISHIRKNIRFAKQRMNILSRSSPTLCFIIPPLFIRCSLLWSLPFPKPSFFKKKQVNKKPVILWITAYPLPELISPSSDLWYFIFIKPFLFFLAFQVCLYIWTMVDTYG